MIFYFLIPFLISAGLIPFLISLSKKNNMLDFSEGDNLKIHKNPTSFLGGLAIFSAIILSFHFFRLTELSFVYVVFAFLIIFLLGLWDDFKWKHISSRKPYLKFFFLVFCSLASALALYLAGIKFYLFPFLAPLYIFVLINAVNYQDGMDGQAGVLFLISIIGFCVLGIISGNNFIFSVCLIFSGAVVGFLLYNFPPAKIFMGDSGAYLLGLALALLAIFFSKDIISHLFIIGLPLFDGVYSNLRRLLSGKSIFWGDREHFYDKMINKGFSVKKTLFISALLQLFFVAVGILAYIYV